MSSLFLIMLGAGVWGQDPVALLRSKAAEAERIESTARAQLSGALRARAAAYRALAAALEAEASGGAVIDAPAAGPPGQSFELWASPPPAPEFEARAIAGVHQTGASSALARHNYFFDFLILRPLGGASAARSRVNLWGEVRIAGSPNQIAPSATIGSLAAELPAGTLRIPINDIAQSAEFLTGIDIGLHTFARRGQERRLGLVAFWGAGGSFTDAASQARIYRIPPRDSPQWANFAGRHPGIASDQTGAGYVAMVAPDRERFYRHYGAGLRLTTFSAARQASPATYMITAGQDQSVSGGGFRGVVARLDVFYPLPTGTRDGRWQFLYLFGSAKLRIARPTPVVPLALEEAAGVKPWDPGVAVIALPSSRDTYRMGVGVDFVNLLSSWR